MSESAAVIDANVVLKSILPNPLQKQCQALLAQLSTYNLHVPALWSYEVTSALTKAVDFEQLTQDEARKALQEIMTLGVKLVLPDETQIQQAFDWTLQLNRASAYDSYYLVLAKSLGCDLWTADRKLVRTVEFPWIRWVKTAARKNGKLWSTQVL